MFRCVSDLNCLEESSTVEEEDVTVVIYKAMNDFGGQRTNTKTEYVEVQSSLLPHSGRIAGATCYQIIVGCLVMLCVLLLAAITVMCIKFSSLTKQPDHNNNTYNLTTERDHLQKDKLRLQKNLAAIDTHAILGWRYFNSSVYYISSGKKNWTESRRDCKDKEADLVIVNSREEQDFISKQIFDNRVWIGLTDRDAEGDWKWVDGTAVTVEYWFEDEPDNYGNNEHCAEIFGPLGKNSWTDVTCSHEEQWICEKNFMVQNHRGK